MKVYKQSDAYKKRVEERERKKREALEAEAERRVEEKKKQIIEEYRKSLKRSGIEDKNLTDTKYSPPPPNISGEDKVEEKEESDDESHPSSCSTCTSDEEGEEDDADQQVDEMYKKMDQLQVDDKIDVSGNLDSIEELEEEKCRIYNKGIKKINSCL